MRLATIKLHGAEIAGIVTGKGFLSVAALIAYKGTGWKEDMMSLIQAGHIPGLTKWYNEGGKEELETIPGVVPAEEVVYAPLYRNPKRIFGIGLNYADHAKDIGNAAPTGFPGSFFKMADTLIGPNDDILLPKLKEAQKTTAEAELGIIMGRDCRDVPEEEWESAIVGYTTILDMTEESVLKGNDFVPGNPRYLTIVKNIPTFVLGLGMCPTLGTTTSAENGMGMGLATMAVLIMSNLVISLIKNIIPDKVRIPAFIVVIASFVPIIQMLMQAFVPALYDALGVFIPLIVVNCIILGRAEAFASKNSPFDSVLDGIGIGLGFTLALTVVGAVREILGSGAVFGVSLGSADYTPLIFVLAPGAFLVLGYLMVLFNKLAKK